MSSLSLGFAKNSFCKPPLAGMEGGYAASLPPAGALATGQQVESSGLHSRAELHGKDAVVKEGCKSDVVIGGQRLFTWATF